MTQVQRSLTQDVIDRMSAAPDPRLRTLMTGLIRHLHAFVEEQAVTQAEWETAIGFLTDVGAICTPERQEFILLSDVLGVSMLVDAIQHNATAGGTESTVFGPFYAGEQPEAQSGSSILKGDDPGEALVIEGHILGPDGAPLPDAKIEVWQTASNGFYDVQDQDQPQGNLRGTFRSDPEGRYAFRTVMPVSYPIPTDGPVGQLLSALARHPFRPAHVHFMISRPDFRRLVTHLFIEGDSYLQSDAVFGVKASLIVRPIEGPSGKRIRYDFTLAAD